LTDLIVDQPGVWLTSEISAESLAAAILQTLQQLGPDERFDHRFLEPFKLESAIAGYEDLIDSALRTKVTHGLHESHDISSIST
jgi:hypothetical protein